MELLIMQSKIRQGDHIDIYPKGIAKLYLLWVTKAQDRVQRGALLLGVSFCNHSELVAG
jgi:hypothetical protein